MSRKTWMVALCAAVMFVTILPISVGAATEDAESSLPLAAGQFDDDDGNTFEADIEWLYAEGITKGCNPPTNNLFCPNDFVTRGQMAAFIVRSKGYTAAGGGANLTDIAGNTFAVDIDKLATAGVTKGCNPPTNNMYCPDDFVTRGQMAAFLRRALNLSSTPPPPPGQCAPPQNATQAECQALVAFYNATGGSSWATKTGWLTGNACDWFGVECAGGHVTELQLSRNNLTGAIPGSILAKLSHLTTLDLGNNGLSGPMPGSLGNLSNLEDLDLSSNDTSGMIPGQLGNLSNLTELSLSDANLTGQIPTSFSGLTSLEVLDLKENSLSGSVRALGGITTLVSLDLQENGFTGFQAAFWSAPALLEFDISGNSLTGTIPSQIGMLNTLTELDMSNNDLGGLIPPSITDLTGLVGAGSLSLCGNTGAAFDFGGNASVMTFVTTRDPNYNTVPCP